MSRRKDRERFLRTREQNPGYVGFRGVNATTQAPPPAPQLESALCSVCQRRRNVPVAELPEDRADYVCLRCQQD